MVLGEVAYEAYGNTRAWATMTGEPMKVWDSLPSDIQEAWEAAAQAAVEGHEQSKFDQAGGCSAVCHHPQKGRIRCTYDSPGHFVHVNVQHGVSWL